jgi:hypothetical protein
MFAFLFHSRHNVTVNDGDKIMSEFAVLGGQELVRRFNEMARTQTGQELNIKEVNRFSTAEVGRKRCEQLASSIRARKNGLKNVKDDGVVVKSAGDTLDVLKTFKTSVGKNRGKLIAFMAMNMGQQIDAEQIKQRVYGHNGSTSALMMVMRGLIKSIPKLNAPFKVVKDGKTYGLYPTERA